MKRCWRDKLCHALCVCFVLLPGRPAREYCCLESTAATNQWQILVGCSCLFSYLSKSVLQMQGNHSSQCVLPPEHVMTSIAAVYVQFTRNHVGSLQDMTWHLKFRLKFRLQDATDVANKEGLGDTSPSLNSAFGRSGFFRENKTSTV